MILANCKREIKRGKKEVNLQRRQWDPATLHYWTIMRNRTPTNSKGTQKPMDHSKSRLSLSLSLSKIMLFFTVPFQPIWSSLYYSRSYPSLESDSPISAFSDHSPSFPYILHTPSSSSSNTTPSTSIHTISVT